MADIVSFSSQHPRSQSCRDHQTTTHTPSSRRSSLSTKARRCSAFTAATGPAPSRLSTARKHISSTARSTRHGEQQEMDRTWRPLTNTASAILTWRAGKETPSKLPKSSTHIWHRYMPAHSIVMITVSNIPSQWHPRLQQQSIWRTTSVFNACHGKKQEPRNRQGNNDHGIVLVQSFLS